MNNIKTYNEFINEGWHEILDYAIPIGTMAFLGLFVRNLIQDFRNRKYKKVFINDILPNLENGKATMTEDDEQIIIDIPKYEIEINKNKKTIWFLNKERGELIVPYNQKESEDGFEMNAVRAQMKYPLKLNKEEFDILLKELKGQKNEEADYRNVTGYGSMGGNGDQRTGPSFNRGPDAATYRLPNVVGTATDDITDPYFAARRDQKVKRIKKNPHIEKNRKKKTKYLRSLDKDTQKNKLLEINSDVDPYGEENWDEKKPNNFIDHYHQRRLQEATVLEE